MDPGHLAMAPTVREVRSGAVVPCSVQRCGLEVVRKERSCGWQLGIILAAASAAARLAYNGGA